MASPVRVTADGEGAIVTLARTPFTSTSVSPSGELRRIGEPLLDSAISNVIQNSGARFWSASPLVSLDSGFLQTLSHLSSDRRFLLRFDKVGRLASSTIVNAPIAVVAADPNVRRLLTARRINELELVNYRWTWKHK